MQEHISIPQPCSLGHTAAVCHNLRPVVRNTKPTALEAATAPSVFINSGNWRPLAAVDIDGTRRLLLSKGHIIASADPEAVSQPAPDEYTGVRLPGDALCAVPDNGSALIMTPEGAVRLSPQTDGTAILRGCAGDYPAVIIYGEDGAGISESTQGCSLSMIYGDGESLRGSDRRRMSDDVADTYSRLAARAAALGAFIQPVLCGYKLYDRRGNLLVASEPMLIGASAGAQCTGIVEAAYDRTFRPVFPAEDPDGIFAVPAPAQAPLPMPSAIVLASSVDPLTPIVVVREAAGRIKAIVAANAGNQAWEYGRNRFIAATTSGIYSLTADLPRRSCSMRMLDSRGTARGDAVCAAGAYIHILAKDTSGRTDLLETSAAGNIRTVASDLPYDIIGLNGARNELWLADSRHPDSVKAFVADAATYRGFTVDPPGIVAFTVCGGSCYALTTEGALLALDRDAMPRSVRIALTACPDIGAGRFTPRFVMLHCSSGAIDGTLTVKATGHGTAPKAVLSRLKISGALRSSLLCRLVSPPREGLETTLEADVSGDFRITAITTGYDTRRN